MAKAANGKTSDFLFITGYEWQHLSQKAQDKYIDRAFGFWRQSGFPYPRFSASDIRRKFRQLQAVNSADIYLSRNELQSSTTGLDLANSFHPQMWAVQFERHRSPLQCFSDDNLLKACLKQALRIWPKRRGASASVLRDILRTFRHTRRVSNFRPTVAKVLYERYSEPGARILDFSAGYGGRLLGLLALEHRHYVGYDPCEAQIKGLQRMQGALCRMGLTQSSAELHQVCAEDAMRAECAGSFDLIFTSPPYFDREKYSLESTQSFMRYPTYDKWRIGFLERVIEESHRLLKTNGYLILNVADFDNSPIASDTRKMATRGFILTMIYHLRLSVLPYRRMNSPGSYRHEPIFVFQKL